MLLPVHFVLPCGVLALARASDEDPPGGPPVEPPPVEAPPPDLEPEVDVPSGPGITGPDVMPMEVPAPDPDPGPPPGDAPDDAPVPTELYAHLPSRPAEDRLEDADEEAPPARRPARVWPLALGLIGVLAAVALVVTFAVLRGDGEGAVPDLLVLAAARAAGAPTTIETADAAEASAFIFDQFGWPLAVPELGAARLEGAGIDPLTEGVELPVLHYRTAEGSPVTVYAYDYAFLDAAARQVALAPAVYARLATPEALDVRRRGDRYLVIWRRRAAIYTAVTPSDAAAQALTEEVRIAR